MSVFTIAADGKSIACHTCGMTGHNLQDVARRHCGCCHMFLDPREPAEELQAGDDAIDSMLDIEIEIGTPAELPAPAPINPWDVVLRCQ
jgi:hypothetical protein